MMRSPATKYDVAEHCGVSHMSVTRVLNNAPHVSVRIREKVLKACGELRYRPNFIAKALSLRRHHTVGVLMYGEGHFYGILNIMLQRQLARHGYTGIFAFWKDARELDNAVESMVGRNVDGIVTVEDCESLRQESLPVVVYGKKVEDYDYVTLDFEHAMRSGLDYLTGLGHRDIGFVGIFGDERYRSFKRFLADQRLPIIPEWHCDGNSLECVENAVRHIFSRSDRPTAIICHNDNIALGVICAVAELGLAIPGEVSIIGCDNLPESAFYNPRLTTFDLSIEKIAARLVDSLVKRMAHPRAKRLSSILKPELVIRKSCGKAPQSEQGGRICDALVSR